MLPNQPLETPLSSASTTKPRGYLGELYLRLYEERWLERAKASRRLACKLEASQVRSTPVLTSPNPNTNTLV